MSKWRRRKREPLAMGEAVAYALDRSGLTDQARRVRIARAWREAVGDTLASRTHPESFRRGVLIVKTASASWQNELTYLRTDLIAAINTHLGEPMVKDIKVVSGRITRHSESPPVNRRPLSTSESAALEDASQAIEDLELRAAFEKAMGAVARRSLRTVPVNDG